jgi:predicted RNA-binding Zn ribbon-like protein
MNTQVTTTARHAADLVRSFVNTLDREDGVDVLDRGWLADHGLLGRGEELEPDELPRLVEVREAVRELLAANAGIPVDLSRAAAVLDANAARARLAVRFRPDGTASVEPEGAGPVRVTGRVLAALAAAIGTDEWRRLKACRWEECRWAFFDESRNRSRAWCSMAACGNRAKARAYRARH